MGENSLFASLTGTQRAALAARFVRRDLPARTELFRRGELLPGLAVVESGHLALATRNAASGALRIAATLRSPDAFGTTALVLGAPSELDVFALEPTVVHVLPKEMLGAIMRQVPEFAIALSRSVAVEASLFAAPGSIPWSDLEHYVFDDRLFACLPAGLAAKGRICPLELSGDTMTVAMIDPREVAALDALSAIVPGVRFRIVACAADDLRRFAAARLAVRKESELGPPSVSSESRVSFRFLSEDLAATKDPRAKASVGPPPPAVSAIEEILGVGLGVGASDIHIEPERSGVVVRYRLDGSLKRRKEPFPGELTKGIVSRLKTLSRLDITETRRPQDGRLSVQLQSGRLIDLRMSTVPAKFGEKVALRVLDSDGAVGDLKSIFAVEQVRTLFTRLLSRKTGFILVTGPTGSGKSTTLYSALNLCRAARDVNIMTVEDPIEYHLDGVTQVEVHPEAGTTFAAVLRALLRQDPNIILVGEMRDAETARIAVEASLTGHLVLSSMHANGTFEAIARLRDIGIEPYAIANGLLAVLHQRLVQRICPYCVAPFDYPPVIVSQLERHGVLERGEPTVLMRGAGCARCQNTGLLGRTTVCGLLLINDDLRDAITHRASLAELRTAAGRGAHIELPSYAGALLRMGVTVPGEVLPLMQNVQD